MTYFDYAATSPMTPAALNTYTTVAQQFFANPNSPHPLGQKAHALLTHCRTQLANALNVAPMSLIFTSGGSESNQLAIGLSIAMLAENKAEVLVSPLEHPSVLHTLKTFPQLKIKTLPLDHGQVTPAILRQAISEKTGLVIVQQTHSITGITQDISALADICAEHDILLHVDAIQSFAKQIVPTSVTSFSCASHKVGGPKSCGLLYLNPAISFTPLLPGISQEFGFRAGTVDLAGIAGFTEAALAMVQKRAGLTERWTSFQQRLWTTLPTWGNFTDYQTTPAITGLISPTLLGTTLVEKLAEEELYLSTTAACNTFGVIDPTLTALGFSQEAAEHFIRISFGESTTLAEVEQLITSLKKYT